MTITYNDFTKLKMQIGTVKFVEPVKGTDKLLRCEIDFGSADASSPDTGEVPTVSKYGTGSEQKSIEGTENTPQSPDVDSSPIQGEHEPPFGKEEYRGRDVRQIVSGIREFYPEYESLVGKQLLYVTNLEPREIRGVTSNGMLMAVDGMDGDPVFLVPEKPVEPGSSVR